MTGLSLGEGLTGISSGLLHNNLGLVDTQGASYQVYLQMLFIES